MAVTWKVGEFVRQGDVGLMKRKSIPARTKKVQDKGQVILAYGESTGHMHRFEHGVELRVDVNDEGRKFIKTMEATALVHNVHTAPVLAKGETCEIIIQRTYTPLGSAYVVD